MCLIIIINKNSNQILFLLYKLRLIQFTVKRIDLKQNLSRDSQLILFITY